MDAQYGMGSRPYETMTCRGASYFYKAFALFIVAGVLSIALAAMSPTALGIAGSLNTTAGGTQALSQLAGLLALTCGLFVIYLVALILALLGLWMMYKGKAEYGTAHEKSVDRAMLFFGAAIAVFIINIAVTVGITLAGIVGDGGTTPRPTAPSPLLVSVSSMLGVLIAVFITLMLYYLAKNLIAPERRDMFVIAVGMYILSSALSATLSAVFPIPSAYYTNPSSVEFDFLWLLPGVVGAAVSLIAVIMFVFLFREIAIRLRTKAIKPIWETTAPWAPQAYQSAEQQRWQPPPTT